MAAALANVGRQRPEQPVRVLSMTYKPRSYFGPRRLVAVGSEYYSVLDMTYQQLRMGLTPAELELDPVDPDAEEPVE
jgi:hypothetical protein